MFVTCEDPWLDNKPAISCIPKGSYAVTKRNSQKHGDHWILKDVPNRSLILIHAGNTLKDTEGCILVGKCFGSLWGIPAVLQSKDTMDMLRGKLEDDFILNIVGGQ